MVIVLTRKQVAIQVRNWLEFYATHTEFNAGPELIARQERWQVRNDTLSPALEDHLLHLIPPWTIHSFRSSVDTPGSPWHRRMQDASAACRRMWLELEWAEEKKAA